MTAEENGCPTASVAVAMRSSALAIRSSAGACSNLRVYLIPAALYPNKRSAANRMTSTTTTHTIAGKNDGMPGICDMRYTMSQPTTTATRMVMSRLITGAFFFRGQLLWLLRYFPTVVDTCDSRNVKTPTAATTIAITMLVEPCAVFTELTCFESLVACAIAVLSILSILVVADDIRSLTDAICRAVTLAAVCILVPSCFICSAVKLLAVCMVTMICFICSAVPSSLLFMAVVFASCCFPTAFSAAISAASIAFCCCSVDCSERVSRSANCLCTPKSTAFNASAKLMNFSS